jgi:hypothetical protein
MIGWIAWPLFKVLPHQHSWRRLTSEEDYGNARSRHWGGYTGCEQEECRTCGIVRYVQGWQSWRYELDDAERRVAYLKSTEPERHDAASGTGK